MKTFDLKTKKSFTDHVKHILGDMVASYTKEQFLKHIEKHIAQRIKKDLKQYFASLVGMITVLVGLLFVFYGAFSLVGYLLELPDFFAPLAFGGLLIVIGLIFYLVKA